MWCTEAAKRWIERENNTIRADSNIQHPIGKNIVTNPRFQHFSNGVHHTFSTIVATTRAGFFLSYFLVFDIQSIKRICCLQELDRWHNVARESTLSLYAQSQRLFALDTNMRVVSWDNHPMEIFSFHSQLQKLNPS